MQTIKQFKDSGYIIDEKCIVHKGDNLNQLVQLVKEICEIVPSDSHLEFNITIFRDNLVQIYFNKNDVESIKIVHTKKNYHYHISDGWHITRAIDCTNEDILNDLRIKFPLNERVLNEI